MLHRDLKKDLKHEFGRLHQDNTRLRQELKEGFARLDSRFSRLEGWFVHHLSRGTQSGGSGGAQSGGSGDASTAS